MIAGGPEGGIAPGIDLAHGTKVLGAFDPQYIREQSGDPLPVCA